MTLPTHLVLAVRLDEPDRRALRPGAERSGRPWQPARSIHPSNGEAAGSTRWEEVTPKEQCPTPAPLHRLDHNTSPPSKKPHEPLPNASAPGLRRLIGAQDVPEGLDERRIASVRDMARQLVKTSSVHRSVARPSQGPGIPLKGHGGARTAIYLPGRYPRTFLECLPVLLLRI